MAVEFNRIIETDTFLKYTEELNKIGEELSKSGNIFTQVNDLKSSLGTSQRYKLTTDTGLALSKTIRYLSDLTQAGTYYVTASVLATLPDKPKSLITSDSIIEIKPTRRAGEVIQQITTLSTNLEDGKVVYRFITQDGNSEWVYFNALSNNRYFSKSLNLPNTTEPGTYFLTNNSTGLPEEIKNTEGIVKIFVDNSNNKYYEYYNNELGMFYTGYKTSSQSSIDWKTNKTDASEIQNFLLGDIGVTSTGIDYAKFGLLVYKSDNIDWETAVLNKLKTGKTTFTFYCQGGVDKSPAGRFSSRGMVISDSPEGGYGIYYAITNGGRLFTGAVNNSTFTSLNTTPSGNILWQGALNFTTVNKTQKMKDTINNYEYVEVYTKLRTFKMTKSKDLIQNVAHKFYRDGETYFVCTGTILGGEFNGTTDTPVQDTYRVSLEFKEDTFQLKDSAINNNKTQYVTRIIGYNMIDAL
ncbi:tail fiber protein [Staphylococcus phage vB_SsapH-Golestan101-M]|nr:tail fiber protein [Staphylococcus phage vB_SsapH-Golestan101-M]